MKKIAILGSTGSLGEQTLDVCRKYSEHCQVVGLSAYKSLEQLRRQAKEFTGAEAVLAAAGESVEKLAQKPDVDLVVNVLPGLAGVSVTKAAIKAGKTLLLGNKESLVAEGESLKAAIKEGKIISLDSEHDAISEILLSEPGLDAVQVFIPCSGGPFLQRENLEEVSIKEALAHPKWKMGPKISLESATLLNKGFEIIEAYYLFNLPLDQITAFIHPECQVHGVVQFESKTLAYYAAPDMREHIENALCRALKLPAPKRDIRQIEPQDFSFPVPPHSKLPGIKIVRRVFKEALESKSPSKAMTHFLQKEELALQKFASKQISFPEIFKLLE